MERVHFSGRVPLIYLEILMLWIEPEKILKPYTYIQFSREHSSAFNIRFSIFHSNQTTGIKIYTLKGKQSFNLKIFILELQLIYEFLNIKRGSC